MLESIPKNQKIQQRVFLDDSFEENRQSLLPTVTAFHSMFLLCSLLAPFAHARNLLKGETYITASLGQAVVRQPRSELLQGGLEIWRDGSAVGKLRWADLCEPIDTATTCHFILPVLHSTAGSFVTCHFTLQFCIASIPCQRHLSCHAHHRLDASR